MNKIKKTLIILLIFACSNVFAAEEYIHLSVRNQSISALIKLICKRAGVNVIVEKSVQGTVTLDLKNMYYENALELICKTNGYELRKVSNTWIIANAKKFAEGFDIGRNEIFDLQFAKPSDMKKIIESTFKGKTESEKVEVSIDKRTNSIVVKGTKNLLEQVKDLINRLDKPVPQVMIEAKIVEVSTTGMRDIGFNWDWGSGDNIPNSDPNEGNPGTGRVFSISEHFVNNSNTNAYQSELAREGNIFGLGDFYRGHSMLQATFSALETLGEAKTLSNPKVATLNGEEANIEVGKKIVYAGGEGGPQEKDVGVKLKITPQINEKKYITIRVEPEVSILESASTATYPVIGQRIVKTTVRVRDGGEVLIGGLIEEDERNSESKVPLLGNIPFIKYLFSRRSKNTNSRQLIVLIKPHIINQI